MATQNEWREIGYQRSLGERGSSTGNIHNEAGYQEYQRQKARDRQYDFGGTGNAPVGVVKGASSGRRTRSGGTSSPASVLALFAGIGAFFYWESFPAAGAAVVGTLIGIKLLKHFFASDAGQLFAMFLDLVVRGALFAVLVWAIWMFGGPKAAMWFLGGAAGLVGFGLCARYLASRYRKYAATPRGAKVNRALVRAWVVAVLSAVGAGGLWIFGQVTAQ